MRQEQSGQGGVFWATQKSRHRGQQREESKKTQAVNTFGGVTIGSQFSVVFAIPTRKHFHCSARKRKTRPRGMRMETNVRG